MVHLGIRECKDHQGYLEVTAVLECQGGRAVRAIVAKTAIVGLLELLARVDGADREEVTETVVTADGVVFKANLVTQDKWEVQAYVGNQGIRGVVGRAEVKGILARLVNEESQDILALQAYLEVQGYQAGVGFLVTAGHEAQADGADYKDTQGCPDCPVNQECQDGAENKDTAE